MRIGQGVTDAELALRAGGGEIPAFEELYRRHVQAAWRVAQAVTGNPHDAADAVSDAFTRVLQALPTRLQSGENFRPYLLASVRNASIDVLRRAGRTTPSDDESVLDGPTLGREPSDLLLADVDADLVAAAFRTLPERWRTVLWLTEVENMPPREVAELLGISANGVAQLAVRARAGLRERFLQAHLRQGEVRKACRATVVNLGAYAAGGLAARDISKVDQHLAGCDACRARVGELEDLSQTLHRSAAPVPLFLAGAVTGRWLAASGAAHMGTGAAGAGAGALGAAGAKVGAGVGAAAATTTAVGGTASLAVASVALFAASILGVRAVDTARRQAASEARHATTTELAAASPDGADGVVPDALVDYPIAGVQVPATDSLLLASPDGGGESDPGFGQPTAPGAPEAIAMMEPVAQLGMWLPGPLAVVLALGDNTAACAGVQVGTVALGCAGNEPAPADGSGPGVSTGGTVLPETSVTVPLPVPADTPAPTPAVRGRSSMRSHFMSTTTATGSR